MFVVGQCIIFTSFGIVRPIFVRHRKLVGEDLMLISYCITFVGPDVVRFSVPFGCDDKINVRPSGCAIHDLVFVLFLSHKVFFAPRYIVFSPYFRCKVLHEALE